MCDEKNPYETWIWIGIIILACFTCVMGMWGFAIAYDTPAFPNTINDVTGAIPHTGSEHANNTPDRSLDLLYSSLQLFTLGSGAQVDVNNWQLEFARFMAPILTLSSLLILFWALLDRWRYFKLFFNPGHVVICGCGYLGPALVRHYRTVDRRFVVLIEKDPSNPSLDSCRELGAMVISGNAVNENLLRRVRIFIASDIFLVTGSDDANAEITVIYDNIVSEPFSVWTRGIFCIENFYRRLLKRSPRKSPRCHVHIEDALLSRTFSTTHPVLNNPHNIEFFNLYRIAGYCVQKINPPPFSEAENVTDAPPIHLLVIGFGRMGENFVLQAVKRWNIRSCGKDFRITIVGRTAVQRLEELKAWYPTLDKHCLITPIDQDTRTLGLDEIRKLFDTTHTHPITRVYICTDNTAKSVSIALMIIEKIRQPGLPVIVRSLYDDGITQVIDKFKTHGSYDTLIPFPIVGSPCCMEWITHGVRNSLAKMIHKTYLTERKRRNTLDDAQPGEEKTEKTLVVESSRALAEWKDLDEGFKEAARLQADDIANKLDQIGYEIEPLSDWAMEPMTFSDDQIEVLARLEHKRWMKAKKDAGYRLGKITDERAKTTPWFIPYDDLPEKQKNMDRVMVRNIPTLLNRINLSIVPKARKKES